MRRRDVAEMEAYIARALTTHEMWPRELPQPAGAAVVLRTRDLYAGPENGALRCGVAVDGIHLVLGKDVLAALPPAGWKRVASDLGMAIEEDGDLYLPRSQMSKARYRFSLPGLGAAPITITPDVLLRAVATVGLLLRGLLGGYWQPPPAKDPSLNPYAPG